jgi:glycerol kinase
MGEPADTGGADDALVLALDQGTTSSRGILFEADGNPLVVRQQEFSQFTPSPGWVEHDPEEIWESQLATARDAVAAAGGRPVRAIGITNQRETTILWERSTGRPVAPAIVWQSRVSEDVCRRLEAAGHGEEIRRRTGLLIDPYFSATKIMHLVESIDGLAERCRRGEILFGTVDSWLIWKFTDGRVHATDPTNASRTLLYDIHERAWSPRLAEIFGVPLSMLPEIRPSAGDFGTTHPRWFGGPLPIRSVAGDQQSAAHAQGCSRPGTAKNTYGTGAFLLFSTGQTPVASRHGLLTTVACQTDAAAGYLLEGSIFVAGAIVSWLRDGLGIIRQAAEIEPLASSVPDSGGVVVVPALTGLGTPYWDPAARGTILGITRGTTAAHLARAAIESIALQVAEVAGCMQQDAGMPLERLRVDGGAAANNLLLQVQADLLGVPVERPLVRETTALGVAMLASHGSLDPAAARRVERVFTPSIDEPVRRRRLALWRAAVERSRGWADVAGRTDDADHRSSVSIARPSPSPISQ